MTKKAFTLAEVLITIAIIGIVAAITIPNLINSYKKSVVETRMRKFYTSMNQAITFSEIENGDKALWPNPYEHTISIKDWWEKYFSKYLKALKYEYTDTHVKVWLVDGSFFRTDGNHIGFYPSAHDKDCEQNCNGKSFTFLFAPNKFTYHKNKGIEPYKYNWDSTENMLRTHEQFGCNENHINGAYCAALIQYHNWKIPENYPVKY